MKTFKWKKIIALLVSTLAMIIANTSSSMCWLWLFEDVKMPKSLYKK